ncbi:hypothetical protein ACH5RR_007856 [Cinchona calisaya]|uniref:RING-type domain-containing protein n=1 Tax=Cinchona calisaya TaxID=153742 RepID=A0ABD3AA26_9GENT
MAESSWMSTRMFTEEVTLTIRRKIRAISLFAAELLPILSMLLNIFGANNNCGRSKGTNDSSSDHCEDDHPTISGEGGNIKGEDNDHNHNHNREVQCVICLNIVSKGEKYRVLGECRHEFHVECIDSWLMQNSTCPLCRCPVAYSPPGKKKQQQISNNNEDDEDQEAYYEILIASVLSFLDHRWTWFLNLLGLDRSFQDYHAYL